MRHVYVGAGARSEGPGYCVVAKLVDERHAAWEAGLAMMQRSGTICPFSIRATVWRCCTYLNFGINALHEGEPLWSGHHGQRPDPPYVACRSWRVRSISTCSRPAGSRRWGWLSQPCAQGPSSKRCAKARGGTAQLLDHLKKGEMATEAERLLKGCGWLPGVRADLVASDDATATEGQGASVQDAAELVAEMLTTAKPSIFQTS